MFDTTLPDYETTSFIPFETDSSSLRNHDSTTKHRDTQLHAQRSHGEMGETYPSVTSLRDDDQGENDKAANNHIRRPRNAFMIFRSDFLQSRKIDQSIEHDHRHVSRIVGHCWRMLSEQEKQTWYYKAEMEKLEHIKKYPNYRYSPVRRPAKQKRKMRRNGEEDILRSEQVTEFIHSGKQGKELAVAVQGIDKERFRKDAPLANNLQQHNQSQPFASSSINSCPYSACEDCDNGLGYISEILPFGDGLQYLSTPGMNRSANAYAIPSSMAPGHCTPFVTNACPEGSSEVWSQNNVAGWSAQGFSNQEDPYNL
ncbi:hypothetical protein D9613_002018 [Agrocybe pediades]|uniref:HMG box domain-containing protein n=1 Tax=Agrocybe pediades TaxID=84607 RepID=A0A8H4R481_9AGAR|nr:hypothetical protein D9613_002018 [Agrocybe pediades]